MYDALLSTQRYQPCHAVHRNIVCGHIAPKMARPQGSKRAREEQPVESHDVLKGIDGVYSKVSLFKHYDGGRVLGRGANAVVREGKHKLTGEAYAFKTVNKDDLVGWSISRGQAKWRLRQVARVGYTHCL